VSDPRLVFLVRHGRSDESSRAITETVRGPQWDPPLDATGRRQAELLARRLAMLSPQPAAVYSSSMRRARQTIAPYASRAGIEVAFEDDLMEANVGAWEAMSFEEIVASDEQILHRLRDQQAIWRHAPGAERPKAFRARVVEAVERILRSHPAGNAVVMAHGGVINAYVGHVLGLDQEMFFLPENTSLNSLLVDGTRRRVRFLNDDRHLIQPEMFAPPDSPGGAP
jgi:2,3-bisphosphoglycerate-dependent phosphoglycerate mutase